jgi:quercetin dioxygenase-like cupin family protein
MAKKKNAKLARQVQNTEKDVELNPKPQIKVLNVEEAIEKDRLTSSDPFKRTYLGHARQSSVFVFQGHKGPFKTHIHVSHDEIGYVLSGAGKVVVGDMVKEVRPGDIWIIPANVPHSGEFTEETNVLFISSPEDVPEYPDRIWLE